METRFLVNSGGGEEEAEDVTVLPPGRSSPRHVADLMLADVCSHVTEHVFLDCRCLLLAANLQFGSSAMRKGSSWFFFSSFLKAPFFCLCLKFGFSLDSFFFGFVLQCLSFQVSFGRFVPETRLG